MTANSPVLQDHDALRKRFEEKADSTLDGLELKSQVSYDRDALRELGVALQDINISDDQQPLDFKPLSKTEYGTYKIDSTRIPKVRRSYYDDFDAFSNWSSSRPLSDTQYMYETTRQIPGYINILKYYSKKDDTDNPSSLEQNSNWYQIL
ncbi:hypothetical protein N7461_007531 [Penicillium sp. DV-2018c]|nr:hypothetical protein N7461_007531 [Penicillium sp. DV-2018c]